MTTPEQADFENRLFSQEVRMAMQVGYSLKMIAWASLNVGSNVPMMGPALVDVFLIHSRLLCEFLKIRPITNLRDFSFCDFLTNSHEEWSGPTLEEVALLEPLWLLASSQVVHFSRERAPATLEGIEPIDLSEETMSGYAEYIFVILERYLAQSINQSSRGLNHLKNEVEHARDILRGSRPDIGPFLSPLI